MRCAAPHLGFGQRPGVRAEVGDGIEGVSAVGKLQRDGALRGGVHVPCRSIVCREQIKVDILDAALVRNSPRAGQSVAGEREGHMPGAVYGRSAYGHLVRAGAGEKQRSQKDMNEGFHGFI